MIRWVIAGLVVLAAGCSSASVGGPGEPVADTHAAADLGGAAPDGGSSDPAAEADVDAWADAGVSWDGAAALDIGPGAAEDEPETAEPPPTTLTACAAGGDYATIQEAVDAAEDGMTVYVCPGWYAEDLVLGARSLSLRATGGYEDTTIMGAAEGKSVVTVTGGDAPGSPPSVTIAGLAIVGGAAAFGGGVLCQGVDLTLEEVAVGANEADFGGGVYADGCTLTITDSLVAENSAAVTGGGAYVLASELVVTGSLFEDNQAWEGGGLAVDQSVMTLTGNEVRDNQSSADDDQTHLVGTGGGGLWLRGTGEVAENTIFGNSAMRHGGGLYVLESPLDVHDNVIEHNLTAVDGAGVYLNRGATLFHHNAVARNEASDDAGGLRVFVGIGAQVTDNAFVANIAAGAGGGVKLSHSANVVARNIFWANVSDNVGGGIELDNESSDVVDCEFVGNSAPKGGGIHGSLNEEEYEIRGCVFESNHADNCGGGLALDNALHEVRLHDLRFVGNTTDTDGGGVCVELVDHDDDDETIITSPVRGTNLVFDGNEAGDDGGAVHVRAGDVTLTNVVMHDNGCTDVGGAVSLKTPAAIELRNAILSSNHGAPTIFADPEDVTAVLAFCDLFGNPEGPVEGLPEPSGAEGNLSAAPLYADPAAGDFTLLPGSPCVDSGDPDLLDPDGSRSDMGAWGGPLAGGLE